MSNHFEEYKRLQEELKNTKSKKYKEEIIEESVINKTEILETIDKPIEKIEKKYKIDHRKKRLILRWSLIFFLILIFLTLFYFLIQSLIFNINNKKTTETINSIKNIEQRNWFFGPKEYNFNQNPDTIGKYVTRPEKWLSTNGNNESLNNNLNSNIEKENQVIEVLK